MANERLLLSRSTAVSEIAPRNFAEVRFLSEADLPALASLMIDAYRGESDDEGETEEDAAAELMATFHGRYGTFLPHASFGLLVDAVLVSAVITTIFEGKPLLAFCMTKQSHKRRGHSGTLISQVLRALSRDGWQDVQLYVSPSNLPALGLYGKLGFSPLEATDGA